MNPVDAKNVLVRALGYTAVFLVFNLLWFLFADTVAARFFFEARLNSGFLPLKEWLHVCFSSFILFLFIYRSIHADRKKTSILELSLRELRESLEGKDLLLREVHHRVKNNLQIVSSIISLQSEFLKSEDDAKLFQSTQGKIIAMAMIHDKLYETGDPASINMHDYIREFIRNQAIHNLNRRNIHIENFSEPLMLPIDSAIPCGLIVNELVMNSLNHAYPVDEAGIVSITCSRDNGNVILTIHDDGIGLQEGECENNGCLGLQLVSSLVKQLGGSMEVSSGEGTTVSVKFPAPREAGNIEGLKGLRFSAEN